jgi:energy-coupling factor transporter ATP-binding protein EcfA2
MSQREVPKTREKRTRRASTVSQNESSLAAAKARPKSGKNERPFAPVELIIENVRCFAGRHEIPIRPLTVLVGENSSGKSTLLAALSIVCDGRFPLNPEFNQPPYSLGNFQTIATYKGGKNGRAPIFSLGFKSRSDAFPNDIDAVPRHLLATYAWNRRMTGLSGLKVTRAKGTAALRLLPGNEKYEIKVVAAPTSDWSTERFQLPAVFRVERESDISQVYLSQAPGFSTRELARALRLSMVFTDLSLTSAVSIAPIRTKPKRTYDEAAEDYSPEGSHVPFVLARILSGGADSKAKRSLLLGLRRFGEESGLFKDIDIRNLGDRPGDPFQVMVTVADGSTNLLDVGYGVSQVLPLVVQSILAADENLLLLQQPEVHLHPKAQAALGSFFVDMLAHAGKSFVVETHSDYIVDRIRMEIADGKLPSEAFLILYLERHGTESTVYPITVDSLGNLLGVPPTYREFFLREAVNLLSRGE